MDREVKIGLFVSKKKWSAFEMLFVCILVLFLSGCGEEDHTAGEAKYSSMEMKLRAGDNLALMNHASIYVFTDTDQFVEKKLNVKRNDYTLSTDMAVGTWNLVLLTSDADLTDCISLPSYGGTSSLPMWKTGLTNDGFLSKVSPELRSAFLPDTEIEFDRLTTRQATLNRNVAKVQVILKDYSGFDMIPPGRNEYAFVDLLDVPTTLNWSGGYYPGNDAPEHSGDTPLREYFNFNNELKADTVNFIVPAHRGTDAFAAQPVDTTTHKLRLRVSMPLNNKSYFGKTPVFLSFVPKVNTIMQVNVLFRGEPDTNLDVKVSVKDWEDPVLQEEVFE